MILMEFSLEQNLHFETKFAELLVPLSSVSSFIINSLYSLGNFKEDLKKILEEKRTSWVKY